MSDTQTKPRYLCFIADEILHLWRKSGKTFYAAEPYRKALSRMSKVSDDYGADSGESIIRYFLCNVAQWRGEDARRIKAELKQHLVKEKKS